MVDVMAVLSDELRADSMAAHLVDSMAPMRADKLVETMV